MIIVKNLEKCYKGSKTPTLQDINFEVSEGEVVGLLGRNGAGKTTLLKCISKMHTITKGEVFINGKDITKSEYILKDVSILLSPLFFNHMTVFDNIKYNLELHGKKAVKDEILEVIKYIGLEKVAFKKPKNFSYGMKQRINLGICIASKPKILLLDEPFIGLDPTGIEDFKKLILNWVKKHKCCVIISSHQLESLTDLCDKYIVIANSKLAFNGVPKNKKIVLELDKNYEGQLFKDYIGKNFVKFEYEGTELNNILEEIMKEYKIKNIEIENNNFLEYFKN